MTSNRELDVPDHPVNPFYRSATVPPSARHAQRVRPSAPRRSVRDGGDYEGLCAPGCEKAWVGDHVCDDECDTPSCNFDGGILHLGRRRPVAVGGAMAWGCPDSWRGDGECDAGCNVTACNFDGGDCNCVPGAKRACVCSGVAGVGMQSCVGGTYGVCKCKDGAMKQVVSREEQRSTHAQNKHCPPHS